MGDKALVIGTGLGGLATALRLSSRGYEVEMVEQYHQPGGRLNQLKKDGFTFDIGPSFFSMSYEFEELFRDCGIKNPLSFNRLDPLYTVDISGRKYKVYRDLEKLAREFSGTENDFKAKAEKFLRAASDIYHDTEYKVIKKNFYGRFHYLASLSSVPLKHGPKLFRSMWTELEKYFHSEDVKVIFSLVAFFLGATPFNTPAVYTLLNYTELKHDGYWNVEGGMYRIVEELVAILEKRNVKIHYNSRITDYVNVNNSVHAFVDEKGKLWEADVFICNGDAAGFRGEVMGKKKYNERSLDKMQWTLAPFTIYLGVQGKLENLEHHNYFLGDNFNKYASEIFRTSVIPEQPYYYVNVTSRSNPESAPENCENLFILCPVPDLRYKKEWNDAEQLAESIINDLSKRTGYNLKNKLISQTIFTPVDWNKKFSLYKGSGLGLGHSMSQVGGFRPGNKDEDLSNLYYVGASTVPGTGLPIVVISSRLVTEKILKDHAGTLS